jgi:hypothetical protein
MATISASTDTATDPSSVVVAKNGERVHLRISVVTADEVAYLNIDGDAVVGSGIRLAHGDKPYELNVTGDYDNWKHGAIHAIRADTADVVLAIFEVSR